MLFLPLYLLGWAAVTLLCWRLDRRHKRPRRPAGLDVLLGFCWPLVLLAAWNDPAHLEDLLKRRAR